MRATHIIALIVAALCMAQVFAQQPAITAGAVDAAVTDADAVLQSVTDAENRYAALKKRQDTVEADMNAFWLLVTGFFVLLMQVGFAMYGVGAVRAVNQGSVVYKIVLGAGMSTLTWWFFGWAFGFGNAGDVSDTRNGFIGNGDFLLVSDGAAMSGYRYGRFFFEWTYALIPTTIVLLAVAERLKASGVILLSVLISSFIYPVIAHWGWSDSGFLSPYSTLTTMGSRGIYDFAGSGVLFLLAGSAGLAAAIAVGPRVDRFEKVEMYAGRNKVFLVTGLALVFMSFFAVSCGRTTRLVGAAGALTASKVLINAVLGGSGGFFGGFSVAYLGMSSTNCDVTLMTDSVLAGLAAVASGVALVEPWAALLFGAVGGLFYAIFRGIIHAVKIDDAFNTFATFAMPGFWGLIATGLMATNANVKRSYDTTNVNYGLFYQGNAELLWAQFVGALCIIAWGFVATFVVVKPLALMGLLTATKEEEQFGLDLAVYTEMAVTEAFADAPRDAWSSKLKPASEEESEEQCEAAEPAEAQQ